MPKDTFRPACNRLVLVFLLVLAACGAPPKPPAPLTVLPNIPVSPGPSPLASPTPLPLETPRETLTTELSATIIASLPPPPTPERPNAVRFDGIAGVELLPLDSDDGSALWAAYTYGLRSFDPQQNHLLAIYTRNNDVWQELGRLELPDIDSLLEAAVEQVQVAPGRIWIEVEGGVGAHSGVYALLSFDGATLRREAEGFSSSPFAGATDDLNGDGVSEVILNQTENYVFCYACGVRRWDFEVLRWDGSRMVSVELAPLPDTAPAEARDANNQAIALAQAGLWPEAQAAISQAIALAQDPALEWNATLIGLTAEARADQARDGPYPLLDNIFYGDYAAALDTMRPYAPNEIFDVAGPLIVDTVAHGFEFELQQWVTETTTLALQAQSDLAAAYFLRGWARYLADPSDPSALADIEQAARLDPNEPLFAESAAYLR